MTLRDRPVVFLEFRWRGALSEGSDDMFWVKKKSILELYMATNLWFLSELPDWMGRTKSSLFSSLLWHFADRTVPRHWRLSIAALLC